MDYTRPCMPSVLLDFLYFVSMNLCAECCIFVRKPIQKKTEMRIEKLDTSSGDYARVEQLMREAFPPEERRNEEQQRWTTEHDARFHCNALYTDNCFVGLLNYWHLARFVYVEHLAISPEWRGRGLGSQALEWLKRQTKMPLVLEVEPPVGITEQLRVRFYERNGFVLWTKALYLQPAYQEGYESVPLKLMVYGALNEDVDLDEVRRLIHTSAYGLSVPLL